MIIKSYEIQKIIIKNNLKDLGIVHDRFINETKIINDSEVEKVINKLN